MTFSPATRGSRSLLRRLAFTALALLAFRVGVAWPAPGVDQQAFADAAAEANPALLRALSFFGGVGGTTLGLCLLGTSPAIVAALAQQLGPRLLPALAQMKEGPGGTERIQSLTRRLALVIALGQAVVVTTSLRRNGLLAGQGIGDAVLLVVSLTLGAMLVMWLAEQIGERGLGQGLSVLIGAGLLAVTAHRVGGWLAEPASAQVVSLAVLASSVALAVYVNGARRQLPLHYPRPQLNELAPAPAARMPVPLNLGGVTPAIFAGALIGAPASVAALTGADWGWLSGRGLGLVLAEAVLVLVFTRAYAGVALDPVETAENLRREGAFIEGVRPGAQTVSCLARLTGRLSLPGGLLLAAVAAAPGLASLWLPAATFLPAGTGVIIVALTVAKARKQAQATLSLGAPLALLDPAAPARRIL